MGLFDFFSKEDKGAKLLQPDNHVAQYLLTVTNEFIMGKENPILSVNTESRILLHQTVSENHIQTGITLQSITGKTEAQVLQAQLKQMLALAEISRQLVFDRNANGKMQRIANMEAVNDEWQQWKQTKLPGLFPLENEQTKFAANFEKGLQRMDESILNNLNYFILLPDIYHIKKYISPSNAGAELLLHSRLIADMPVRCRFVPIEISEAGGRAFVKMNAELLNVYEIQKMHLKTYYKKQTDFHINDYSFAIDLDYEINSLNGQILNGNLFLKEKMHDHLQYILHIQAEAIQESNESASRPLTQSTKHRFLADEIIERKG